MFELATFFSLVLDGEKTLSENAQERLRQQELVELIKLREAVSFFSDMVDREIDSRQQD